MNSHLNPDMDRNVRRLGLDLGPIQSLDLDRGRVKGQRNGFFHYYCQTKL